MKLGGASFIVSAAKRVQHYGAIGLADLRDRSSRTRCSPRQTSAAIGHHVENLRRLRWNGGRIVRELALSRPPSATSFAA